MPIHLSRWRRVPTTIVLLVFSAIRAEAQDSSPYLAIAAPFVVPTVTNNKITNPNVYTSASPDAVVQASTATRFAGTASSLVTNGGTTDSGITCVTVQLGSAPPIRMYVAGDDWSGIVDTSNLDTGPNVVSIVGTDIAGTIKLKSRFIMLVDNPGKPVLPPAIPALARGMSIALQDGFNGTALNLTRWHAGSKPSSVDNGQFGDATLIDSADPDSAMIYNVQDHFLRIRAKETIAASKKTWTSGLISSIQADGTGAASATTGYFEIRALVPMGYNDNAGNPVGAGIWPALWLLPVSSVQGKPADGYEIDTEYYGFAGFIQYATHHYRDGHQVDGVAGMSNAGIPLGLDFHKYGILLTETDIEWYIDDVQQCWTTNGTRLCSLPRPDLGNLQPYFMLIDNEIGGGFPVQDPPSGYHDLWIDYARIYKAS